MRLILGFLCLLSIVACDTTGKTADLPPPSPPAATNDDQGKTQESPVAPAPEAAKPVVVEVSPSEAWDRGLCQHKLPTNMVDAYTAGVFSTVVSAAPETVTPGCKYAVAGSRIAGRMSATLRIDRSLKVGQERLLRAVMMNPDNLLARDAQGRGLAQVIVDHDDIEMVKQLMQFNLWTYMAMPDQLKRLPLHYARSRAMLELLADNTGSLQQDSRGQTPLNRMAEKGYGEAVQFMMTQICPDSDSYFPWRWSYEVGHKLYTWVSGDEINLADNAGRTPLMSAVRSGDFDSVNILASCSSTVMNAVDKSKRTALHYAAALPSFTAGYAILVKGTMGVSTYVHVNQVTHVDVNAQDQDATKDTPLHIAYRCGNAEAIEILKDFGADIKILNKKGLAADDVRSIAQGCPKNDAM